MKVVLTIAGSDSSGGAGIQADIKTITCNGCYAMSAITSLTAQCTTGVSSIMDVNPDFLYDELKTTVTDIMPDACKIGMVSSRNLIDVIASSITEFNLKNIVLDPVMVSTSGSRLITTDAVEVLEKKLMPLSSLVTPNIPESEILSGMKIKSPLDMEKSASVIFEKYGCAVLVKGGHSLNDANDFLFDGKKAFWFNGHRIKNPNTHGTGCTLSSAIACGLAKGHNMEDSVKNAKKYLSDALEAGLDLGKGSGPVMHNFMIGER